MGRKDEYGELNNEFYEITELLDENGNFELPIELIVWREGDDLDGRQYTIGVCAVDGGKRRKGGQWMQILEL